MEVNEMSKIWKSKLAMKLSCPAYKSDAPDPCRMEVFKALHELTRLQHRISMKREGFRIVETEMWIENEELIGRIDDVVQDRDGRIIAIDYVSSPLPKMYKLADAAISAAFLRHVLGTDASGRVATPLGVTDVPDALGEIAWSTIMSEEFQEILSLSGDELLEYANPASGICGYCANEECRRKPQ
jgi:hypothetical protein